MDRPAKQVLIVAPQFPPSNMTAGHRCRYFAAHLPEFGWRVLVLSVEPRYYTGNLDYELEKLVAQETQVIRTKATPVSFLRFISDISIRSFWWHYRAICAILKKERIDLIYIPVPPYYSMLLGPLIRRRFGVPYAVDYIDPWVHPFPGCETWFSKNWLAYQSSRVLEPIGLRSVSLITAVAPGYYEGVLKRYSWLHGVPRLAIAYGAEDGDYAYLDKHPRPAYLFDPLDGNFHIVYSGALLPRAKPVLDAFFEAVVNLRRIRPEVIKRLKLYFIGTGSKPDDPKSFSIKPVAERFGLSDCLVEKAERIPYLDVLNHLKKSTAVLIIGSTEPHYTPSKVFQAVESGRPVLAILRAESTAVEFLEKARSGVIVSFDSEGLGQKHKETIAGAINDIIEGKYASEQKSGTLDVFSTREMTRRLGEAFDSITH